ncbi:carbon-nitrogen hydrolase family protein [Azospirillum thermophilum]|uniref:Carbon-nitrogen hydrolase n=1 Tax=Azospirillum thermophilum TaxID=2202148 RepID=A0A2S2CLG9_9PROT|nr:carbon-nitrogen hydrolase family protein [Azospirillum thermophilum]AWK85321.1 carbon-nitrogen hydrolase [Azospirillum thermophilum]
MRIALFQTGGGDGKAGTLDRIGRAAAEAAAGGGALLICPEMVLTGYDIGPDAVRAGAEPADGPSAARLAETARASGIAILYGYPERGADGAVYNAAQLIGPDGRPLLNQRKTHLYGELDRSCFAAGPDAFALAEVGGLRCGVLICYDVEFPELVRRHALAGADAVLVPTALMDPYRIVAETIVPARAFENGLYVAYANRCGREGRLTYCGLSTVAGPDGSVLARAGQSEELLVAELDPARLAALRAAGTHLDDRRPELYRNNATPRTEG